VTAEDDEEMVVADEPEPLEKEEDDGEP